MKAAGETGTIPFLPTFMHASGCMNPEIITSTIGFHLQQYHPVAGGDSNACFYLRCREGVFFLKLKEADLYPALFQKEARGLAALKNTCTISVPEVLATGETNGYQYLLLQWFERGAPAPVFWEQLGHSLAMLHRQPQAYFGWEEENYIGLLPQFNHRHNTWAEFYARERIEPLVRQLSDSGAFDAAVRYAADRCYRQMAEIYPPEPAALLHGDLWSGNIMALESGNPAFFDPAVYYGHREMDLAMTLLFGGFHQRFYEAYHEVYPLQPGWEERMELSQLYPLLVHAVLFGGHYVQQASAVIKKWSSLV